MKKLLTGALGILLLAVAAAALVQAGCVDVAADTPHSPLVYRLIEWTRERSVDRQSQDVAPPVNLAEPERIRRGAGNYDAMCADCHTAPGREDSELRKGLYPQPPDFSRRAAESGDSGRENARRFWIIKHGIKASAMPAWSRAGVDDEGVWDLVAFLKVLPGLSAEDYRWQVESSDGHRHGGMNAQHSPPPTGADRHPSASAHEPIHHHPAHAH